MIEILTADEVAELLRLSANRVLMLAHRGEIPSLMIDGRVRFDAVEIEGWLKGQARPVRWDMREREGFGVRLLRLNNLVGAAVSVNSLITLNPSRRTR